MHLADARLVPVQPTAGGRLARYDQVICLVGDDPGRIGTTALFEACRTHHGDARSLVNKIAGIVERSAGSLPPFVVVAGVVAGDADGLLVAVHGTVEVTARQASGPLRLGGGDVGSWTTAEVLDAAYLWAAVPGGIHGPVPALVDLQRGVAPAAGFVLLPGGVTPSELGLDEARAFDPPAPPAAPDTPVPIASPAERQADTPVPDDGEPVPGARPVAPAEVAEVPPPAAVPPPAGIVAPPEPGPPAPAPAPAPADVPVAGPPVAAPADPPAAAGPPPPSVDLVAAVAAVTPPGPTGPDATPPAPEPIAAVVPDPVVPDPVEAGPPAPAQVPVPPAPAAPEPSPPVLPVGWGPAGAAGAGASFRLVELRPTEAPPVAAPLPVAAAPEPAAPPAGAPAGAVVVEGVRCSRDHFNDPRARYCAVCGIAMFQASVVLTRGPRPPLGVIVLDSGESFPLLRDRIIGREPDVHPDVVADTADPLQPGRFGPRLSRLHARIRLDGWNVVLVDEGSTNGTFVWDETRRQWAPLPAGTSRILRPGDHIAFGDLTATFETSIQQ